MLFRVENIPHRDRKAFGKCRACKRHSTYKIKLHRLRACLRFTGKYEETINKKGKKVNSPILKKEFRPIGKHPYLLCSKRCITLAELAFL